MPTLNGQDIIKSLLSSTYLCIRGTLLQETEGSGDIGIARAGWKLSSGFEDLYFGLGNQVSAVSPAPSKAVAFCYRTYWRYHPTQRISGEKARDAVSPLTVVLFVCASLLMLSGLWPKFPLCGSITYCEVYVRINKSACKQVKPWLNGEALC